MLNSIRINSNTKRINNMFEFLKIPTQVNFRYVKYYFYLALIGNIITYLRLIQFNELFFPLTKNDGLINNLFLASCILLNLFQFKFYKNYYLSIFNLILSGFILRTLFTYGIFELTVLYANWLLVFFSLILFGQNKKNKFQNIGITGSYLTILMFGLTFFSSGFYKLIDPYWINGTGFQNFIQLDWIHNGNMNFFLGKKLALINYLTILFEIGFVFLFFFKRTRKLSFYIYSIIGIQLFFPFNIFLIGYFAMVFSIPVFIFSYNEGESFSKKINVWILSIFLINLILFAQDNVNYIISRYLLTNEKSIPFKEINVVKLKLDNTIGDSRKSIYEAYFLKDLSNIFNFLKLRYLPYKRTDLFSSSHTVGIYSYQIEYTDEDGKLNNFDIFKENSERGDIINSYFQINGFQGAMYSFGDLINYYHLLSEDDFKDTLVKYLKNVYYPMILWLENKNKTIIKQASFLVSPTGKNCNNDLNHTLFEIDFEKMELLYFEPNTIDCDNGRHPKLMNYLKDL